MHSMLVIQGRLAFDQRHHAGMGLIGFLHSEDGGDVRMVQGGKRRGFAIKACDAIPISRKGLGQDLDGHVTIELGVAGPTDFPHAALADLCCDLVMGDGQVDHGGSVTDYPSAVSHRRVLNHFSPTHRPLS